jgi:hypothetical protein
LQIFSLVRSVGESHAVRAFHSGKSDGCSNFLQQGLKASVLAVTNLQDGMAMIQEHMAGSSAHMRVLYFL